MKNKNDIIENTIPVDDEHRDSPVDSGVAAWEYKNSDEDFTRLLLVDLEGLHQQVLSGYISEEDVPKIVYGMEAMFNVIKTAYNVMPKEPKYDNKKPNDFKGFQEGNFAEKTVKSDTK